MTKLEFSPSEIIYSYTPRLSGVSVVEMYHFTYKTPSEVITELDAGNSTSFSPHNILLSSGKNNNEFFKKLALDHSNEPFTRGWSFVYNSNQFYQVNSFVNCEPFWCHAIKSNYSFDKLYEAQNILKRLYLLPFVRQIYVCGSVALGQSTKFSDLDLILVSKSFLGLSTVAICRFWAKLYLKLINRDVHPFLNHYLWIFSLKLGLKKWSQSLQMSFQKYNQNSRLRFDVGLIVDKNINLDNYVVNDTDRLWFLARKKVVFDQVIDANSDFQNNIFLNGFKFHTNLLLQPFKTILELISIVLFPIFALQYLWFWLFNKDDINQFVSYKIWHSFTKVGFAKERVVRTGRVVYKEHVTKNMIHHRN